MGELALVSVFLALISSNVAIVFIGVAIIAATTLVAWLLLRYWRPLRG
jgi:hypothetical protein